MTRQSALYTVKLVYCQTVYSLSSVISRTAKPAVDTVSPCRNYGANTAKHVDHLHVFIN